MGNESKKMNEKYYVYGVDSKGYRWYLLDKEDKDCHVWQGAPKKLRQVFEDKEEAQAKANELNELSKKTFLYSREFHICIAETSDSAQALCPKCGNKLVESDLAEYKYLCKNCDENFYEIEIRHYME